MQSLSIQFNAPAQITGAEQKDLVLAKFHRTDPGADVILVKRITRVFILFAEFRSTDGARGAAGVQPCRQCPGLLSVAVKLSRRARQVQA